MNGIGALLTEAPGVPPPSLPPREDTTGVSSPQLTQGPAPDPELAGHPWRWTSQPPEL